MDNATLDSIWLCSDDAVIANIRMPTSGGGDTDQEEGHLPGWCLFRQCQCWPITLSFGSHTFPCYLQSTHSMSDCVLRTLNILPYLTYKTLWNRHFLSIPVSDGNWRYKAFNNLSKIIRLVGANQNLNQTVWFQSLYCHPQGLYVILHLCCNYSLNDVGFCQTARFLNEEPCWSCLSFYSQRRNNAWHVTGVYIQFLKIELK